MLVKKKKKTKTKETKAKEPKMNSVCDIDNDSIMESDDDLQEEEYCDE